MTVAELIEELKKASQDEDVYLVCPGWGEEHLARVSIDKYGCANLIPDPEDHNTHDYPRS